MRIEVSDTGTGIEPDVLPHVFEPFFSTKEFGHGAGLGLSSVEGAVAQSGGFVSARSELGRGSTFAIFLPQAVEDVEQPVRPRHTAAARGGTNENGACTLPSGVVISSGYLPDTAD